MTATSCVKRATNKFKLKYIIMEALAGILIVLIIFAAAFGIIYVIVTAQNRERMSMIEKGVNPKDFMAPKKSNTYGIIKWALLLTGVGLGLFLGSLLDEYTTLPDEPGYFAGALIFGGLGLALAFLIQKKFKANGME